jgi:hypothetical protein
MFQPPCNRPTSRAATIALWLVVTTVLTFVFALEYC